MIQHPAFGWLPYDVHETPTEDLEQAAYNYIHFKKERCKQSEAQILENIFDYMFMFTRQVFHDKE